jgi:GABA(A) receptor-associated protein
MDAEEKLSPEEFERLSRTFPDRIPVFVLRARGCAPEVPHLAKKKFIVPKSLNVGQFVYIIRRQMSMPAETALFLFVGNTLPTTGTSMTELYHQYKSEDGALRVMYTSESVFG